MTKYQRLVDLLVKRTSDGTAGWQPTPRSGVFSLALPDFSVLISMVRSDDPNAEHDVLLQIVNSEGTVIDRARDVDIVGDLPDRPGFFQLIEHLYDDARRQALGVDKALDKLLEELDKPLKPAG